MYIYIYKISNNDTSYIGSTKNFTARMACHKSRCNNASDKYYNQFLYQYIRQHGGWDHFNKEIIHESDVSDRVEQRMIEQQFIEKNECKLNQCKSYRSREDRNKYKAQYNRKKITCKCGSVVSSGGYAKHERTTNHQIRVSKNEIAVIDINGGSS